MLGPLGRPFEVDPRTRHVCSSPVGLGIAGVRALADAAIRDGRQVTLLFGGASARDVYPSSLLPDEVEYIVATDDGSVGHHGFVTQLVADYEAWADQAFACGPLPMLRALAGLSASRRRRMGVASWDGSAAPGGSPRPGSARRAGRRSSRCQWSRTWVAPSGHASAASSWTPKAHRNGSAARGRCSPRTSSTGRAAGEGQAPVVTSGGCASTKRRPTVRKIKPAILPATRRAATLAPAPPSIAPSAGQSGNGAGDR
jgi:hypothetical protein